MRRWEYVTNERTRTTTKELNEMEIKNTPNKKFKVMVIKMPTGLKM